MPRKNPNAGVLFGTDIANKEMEYLGYMGNYRHLGQAVAEIQAGLPVQLYARGGMPFAFRLRFAISAAAE